MEENCNVIPMPMPDDAKKVWEKVLLVAIPAAIGFVAGWAVSQFSGTTDDYDEDEETEE